MSDKKATGKNTDTGLPPPITRKKKSAPKNSQLLIRINSEDRDRFVELCEELDTSAAREIRRFIRRFMQEHSDSQGFGD